MTSLKDNFNKNVSTLPSNNLNVLFANLDTLKINQENVWLVKHLMKVVFNVITVPLKDASCAELITKWIIKEIVSQLSNKLQ